MSSNYATGDARDTVTVVHRAGPIGELHVPRLVIRADEETPEFNGDDWEERYRSFYENQGHALAEALIHHLPMATVDYLLVQLLRHKATLLRPAFQALVWSPDPGLELARAVVKYFGDGPINKTLDGDIALRDQARAVIAKAETR